jgi:hypothetical protein
MAAINANRKFKDNFFVALFNDKPAALELYNAITGSSYSTDTPVEIKTLPDIFYRAQKNDLAFKLGGKLVVFIEHQSTINPNMALRLLLYAADVYKSLIDLEAMYGKKMAIPRPEFYVLCNAPGEFPDMEEHKLSSLYAEQGGRIDLELTLRVYNINHGRNREILARSGRLDGYALLVDKIREYFEAPRGSSPEERKAGLGAAIKKAVDYCVKHGILKEFLLNNAGEVVNMLTTEFDINVAERVWKKMAWEEGMERGLAEGMETAARNALNMGLSIEMVHTMTGLATETIENLARQTQR